MQMCNCERDPALVQCRAPRRELEAARRSVVRDHELMYESTDRRRPRSSPDRQASDDLYFNPPPLRPAA